MKFVELRFIGFKIVWIRLHNQTFEQKSYFYCKTQRTMRCLIKGIRLAQGIVDQLNAKHVRNVENFVWRRSLRYYWKKGKDSSVKTEPLHVAMVDSRIPYGFEYIGNADQLAITPSLEKGFQ